MPIKLKRKNGTITADGFVPYLPYRGIDLPVALDVPAARRNRRAYSAPLPTRRTVDGRRLYVLPGGGLISL